jgi:hypothetical protein
MGTGPGSSSNACSWIAWRYPYPRAVAVLQLCHVPASLTKTDLELVCQPEGSDCLVVVPMIFVASEATDRGVNITYVSQV